MNSTTKIFGCIADPIDHVKAPTLFTSEFHKRKIDAIMIPIHASKESLGEVINGLKKIKNFYGSTITIPHKVEILNYCDELGVDAQETGAVNWLKFDKDKNKVIGNNFDGVGFVNGFKSNDIDFEEKSICIFGAGGSAMAIAFALIKLNIKKLKIINRDFVRGKNLVHRLKKLYPNMNLSFETLQNYNLSESDIIINATSVGLKTSNKIPFDISLTKKNCLIVDIIMDPSETLLIKEARKLKKQVLLGKFMLEGQLVYFGKYFKLW